MKRVDWSQFDWTKRNVELSRLHGCSETAICLHRKRHNIQNPPRHGKWRTYEDEVSLFFSQIDRRGTDECWPWIGVSTTTRGYGCFQRTGSHRYMYALVYGPIPDGLFVCHKCDNPPCCNPNHLFLSTHQGNMIDCLHKGRHQYAKLDVESVRKIRSEVTGRDSIITKAMEFDVTPDAIKNILKGKSWAHVQ